MTTEEMCQTVQNLVFAIFDDDLENAKTYVDLLNINCTKEKDKDLYYSFNQYNPFTIISQSIRNFTFEYVIENLENVENIDYYRWFYLNRKIWEDEDFDKMRELCNDFVYHQEKLKKYIDVVGFEQIKLHLIQYCFSLKDYDLLNKIKFITKEQ